MLSFGQKLCSRPQFNCGHVRKLRLSKPQQRRRIRVHRPHSMVIALSWRNNIWAFHLSKLSQTRYESGDGRIRLMCAVSATHNESGEVPYFWFALHNAQLEFLDTVKSPYICLGCSSAKTTLLVPLSVIRNILGMLSITKTDDRQYWHIVIQKKSGKFVVRLLGAKDGPDVTEFDIGSGVASPVLLQN